MDQKLRLYERQSSYLLFTLLVCISLLMLFLSQKFLEGAKEAGFSHFEVIGQDPRVLSQNVSKRHDIPYHHFFVFKSYLIQLVVFYVRSNRYLWHGWIDWSQVNPPLERWRDDQTLYGNRGEGAYDM